MLGLGINLVRPSSGYGPNTTVDLMTGTGLANLSISRASSGWAEDSAGLINSFGSNVLRRTDKGLYISQASTNKVRNGSGSGGAAGTPGTTPTNWSMSTTGSGLTRTLAFGTDSLTGLPYCEARFVGTASSAATLIMAHEAPSAIAAAQNDVWTGSVWAALVAGSTSGLSALIFECTAFSGSSRLEVGNISLLGGALDGTMRRFSVAHTMASASTANVGCRIVPTCTNGAAIDFTIRFAGFQIEKLPYSTQIIPTAGSELTRAADDVSLASTLLADLQGAAGSIVLDISLFRAPSGNILGGSAGTILRGGAGGSETTVVAPDGTPLTATIGGGLRCDTGTFKVGLAWDAGGRSLVANNGTLVTNASAIGARTTAKLGQYSGAYGDGIVRSIRSWTSRLSDTDLKAQTI